MKKLLSLLSIFAIVLSCSSDETSTPVTPPPAVPIEEASLRVSLNESLESVNTLIKPQIQELLDELNQLKENYLSKKINQQVFISSMSQIEVKLDDIYFENNIMEDGIYYFNYQYIRIDNINRPEDIEKYYEEINDVNYSSDIYVGRGFPLNFDFKKGGINWCLKVVDGKVTEKGNFIAYSARLGYEEDGCEVAPLYTGDGLHWTPMSIHSDYYSIYAKGKGQLYLYATDYKDKLPIFLFQYFGEEEIYPRIEDVQEEDEFWGDEVYKEIDWNDPVSYVMAFLKDAERHGVDLSFVNKESIIAEVVETLPNLSGQSGAASYASFDKTKVDIKFKKDFWETLSYYNKNNSRIRIVWHELGHDILQLDHNDTEGVGEDYWCSDLMHALFFPFDGFSAYTFNTFQKDVVRLFNGEGQKKLNYASKGQRVIACDFEIKD